MKRTKQATQSQRYKRTEEMKRKGTSRYARKVARGNQMYGPGCCANKVTLKENV